MPDVLSLEKIGGYRLLLTFEDGQRREIDVTEIVPFEGVFEPLRDPSFFGQVRVEPDLGTIVWPNGADICPDVLAESGRQVTLSSA